MFGLQLDLSVCKGKKKNSKKVNAQHLDKQKRGSQLWLLSQEQSFFSPETEQILKNLRIRPSRHLPMVVFFPLRYIVVFPCCSFHHTAAASLQLTPNQHTDVSAASNIWKHPHVRWLELTAGGMWREQTARTTEGVAYWGWRWHRPERRRWRWWRRPRPRPTT